jgi:hypothetical protein
MISYITFHIMNTYHTLDYWFRRRDRLLKKLATVGPFVDASLVTIARTCGNPRCRCARGEKHRSRYLTCKVKPDDEGRPKTQTIYVPVALQAQAVSWVKEYKRLKGLLRDIGAAQKMIVRCYVKERGRESETTCV